jgi:hypothetical protein
MTLKERLNNELDPTDADLCMKIAMRSLRLLVVCQRVLFANNAGLCVGRDDSTELAVKMRDVGETLGLLAYQATAQESHDFHATLEIEAGLAPSPLPEPPK